MRRGLFAVGTRETALDYEQRIGAIAIEQPHRHIRLVLRLRIGRQVHAPQLPAPSGGSRSNVRNTQRMHLIANVMCHDHRFFVLNPWQNAGEFFAAIPST